MSLGDVMADMQMRMRMRILVFALRVQDKEFSIGRVVSFEEEYGWGFD
ncbi:16043_t:CDS:2 [Rhizophagus irregularis]|nr:16043_t:CDS:2 [Rhizophagus irregularis]